MKLKKFETVQELNEFVYEHKKCTIVFWDIIRVIKFKNEKNYKKMNDYKAQECFIQIWNELVYQDNVNFTLRGDGTIRFLVATLLQELKRDE
jgi:hypothetical protein